MYNEIILSPQSYEKNGSSLENLCSLMNQEFALGIVLIILSMWKPTG